MAKDKEGMDETKGPDPWVVMQQMADAISGLKDVIASRPSEPVENRANELMEKLSGALVRLSESQLESGKLIASETRKANRPSNEVAPGVSVFNRRGDLLADYQKPKLKCIMLLPWLAEWESLTREEVELLNLLESGEYMVARIDKSKVKVTVRIDYAVDQVTPSRLLLNHDTAFNNDNFKMWPAITDWTRQIHKQLGGVIWAESQRIITDEEEEALIESGELSVSV